MSEKSKERKNLKLTLRAQSNSETRIRSLAIIRFAQSDLVEDMQTIIFLEVFNFWLTLLNLQYLRNTESLCGIFFH